MHAARSFRARLRRWAIGTALVAVLLLGAAMATGWAPLINDISTDRDDPPRYAVVPPRQPAYDAEALREPTARAYGDLANLEPAVPPAQAFAAVEALVALRGWRVVARSEGAGDAPWRLQAVDTTRWLRFKDDVVIEVRPRAAPGGGPAGGAGSPASTVAMRSKSRLGTGDLGVNARRIRAFLGDLRARLGG